MDVNMTRRGFVKGAAGLAAAGLALDGCAPGNSAQNGSSPKESSSEHLNVWDLHCDTIGVLGLHNWAPYNTEEEDMCRDGNIASNNAQVSIDRMTGMNFCQCYAIWTADKEEQSDPLGFYRAGVSYFKQQLADHAQLITQVHNSSEVDAAFAEGRIAAMLTVESARALESGLDIIEEYVRDGVTICSLTWNKENPLGGGAHTSTGLTDYGKQCVKELEDAGIVLDTSHMSDASFDDLVKIATKPFIATHSNARAIQDVPRNLNDYQIEYLIEIGGLIGFNGYYEFIGNDEDPTYDQAAKHLEHLLELGAENVLALGADFDGGTSLSWLNGVQDIPAFYDMVSKRFGTDIAENMFFQNAHRFFAKS